MKRISLFAQEFEEEVITTRKMLAVVPNDKYDWKPHPKSMNMLQLTTHIAELPQWISMVFNTSELDLAAMDFTPTVISETAQLMEIFEKSVDTARTSFATAKEESLNEIWVLRSGTKIYTRDPRWGMIRTSISQIIHHRAQLGVYLRLLDVPIPGSYGPSADEEFEAIEG